MNLAPNGKPSNLTNEQYKIVRTSAFKKWFGDWENDSENASKVVDENGEPLVVYHGTNAEFTVFDTDEESKNRKGGTWSAEYPDGYIFMISDIKRAKYYGKRIIPLFVNMKYPTIRKVKKGESLVLPFDDEGLAYEGDAIVTDGIEYVVGTQDEFQIKLADGTNTTFDKKNPDIRYETGGLIDDTFTLTDYIITIGDDMYLETQYKGNDYDIALREYNNISPSDFVNKNSTSNYKTLEKGYNKYKFIGEVEDGDEITDYIDYLDDNSYWKIIEESNELETLLVDNVEGINESTDDIIKDIQEFINDEYGDSKYGSKYMNIKVYDDDESIDTITIRIADHSQNPRNIKNEHHLSFVIANENATKSRFRSNYEYYFDDSDDIDYIKGEIKKIIDEKIQDMKEKKYETGGNIKFTYTIGGL